MRTGIGNSGGIYEGFEGVCGRFRVWRGGFERVVVGFGAAEIAGGGGGGGVLGIGGGRFERESGGGDGGGVVFSGEDGGSGEG